MRALPLASAQDYKRIFDGDGGPNTGGMGSYSPVPAIGDDAGTGAGRRSCISRCSTSLRRRGIDFHGVLYAGLMLTPDGVKVLEFNARFGDPETQAILPRLSTDLLELLTAAAAGVASGLDRSRSSTGTRAAPSPWCSRAPATRRAPRAAM